MKLRDTLATSVDSLLVLAIGTHKIPFVYVIIENRVIAPGEFIKLIKVRERFLAERLLYELSEQRGFEFAINYESIYGQRWICEGYEVRYLESIK